MLKYVAWILFVALLVAVCYLTWHFLRAIRAERLTQALAMKFNAWAGELDEEVQPDMRLPEEAVAE